MTTDLAALAAAFGRRLHDAGAPVTTERIARFAEAITLAPPVIGEELYWMGRVTLLTSRHQIPLYDAVFALVFGGRLSTAHGPGASPGASVELDVAGPGRAASEAADEAGPPDRGPDPAAGPDQEAGTLAAGSAQALRHKAFADCTPEELAILRSLVAELRLAPPPRASRRQHRHLQGRRPDVRATLRRSQRTAGDPVDWVVRRPTTKRRRLVVLADVSGSMEPYSRMLLHLLHSAVRAARAETFVFSTRLTRITRALSDTNPDVALARASREVSDWSGGTLIGGALAVFNNGWGRRGIARGSVVVIVSDGCDFGDPTVVAREMERLARLAHRIIWVNPRAARPTYEPRFRGMLAALPHVDALVSGHSLDALSRLVEAIRSEGSLVPSLLDTLGPLPQEIPATRRVTSYLLGVPPGG